MPGPVLSVQTKPAEFGGTAAQARGAAAEVKRLETELMRAAKLGQVPQQLNDSIKVAKQRSDELKKIVQHDKEELRGFRNEKFFTKRGVGLAHWIAGGAQLDLYSMEAMLASPKTAKLAKRLGLGGVADSLMRIMPTAYLAKEALHVLHAVGESREDDRKSRAEVSKLYAEGRITKKQQDRLLDIGSDGGWRYFAGLLNSDWSPAGARNKILKEGKNLGTDEKKLRFIKKALLWEHDPNRTDADIRADERLVENYERKLKAARKAHEREYGAADEKDIDLIASGLQEELRRSNPDFMKRIEKLNDIAGELETADAIKHPSKKKTLAEQYHEQIDVLSRRALHNEYKRGYVPFNRNE